MRKGGGDVESASGARDMLEEPSSRRKAAAARRPRENYLRSSMHSETPDLSTVPPGVRAGLANQEVLRFIKEFKVYPRCRAPPAPHAIRMPARAVCAGGRQAAALVPRAPLVAVDGRLARMGESSDSAWGERLPG
jgi:hypothetical protein